MYTLPWPPSFLLSSCCRPGTRPGTSMHYRPRPGPGSRRCEGRGCRVLVPCMSETGAAVCWCPASEAAGRWCPPWPPQWFCLPCHVRLCLVCLCTQDGCRCIALSRRTLDASPAPGVALLPSPHPTEPLAGYWIPSMQVRLLLCCRQGRSVPPHRLCRPHLPRRRACR